MPLETTQQQQQQQQYSLEKKKVLQLRAKEFSRLHGEIRQRPNDGTPYSTF